MSDINYEYVKGRGWVAIPPQNIVKMHCGTLVRVEFRRPQRGERFFAAYKTHSSYHNGDRMLSENGREDFEGASYGGVFTARDPEDYPEDEYELLVGVIL